MTRTLPLFTALRFLTLVAAIVATIWVYRAWMARSLPDLQIWHTYTPENEFDADDYPDGISLPDYLRLEQRLFQELDEHVYSVSDQFVGSRFNRYDKASAAFAGESAQQWNRSFELVAPETRGGILLIHGASDSPYSTRALARLFNSHGFYVLSVRLPGNGTIPSGLREARLDDWLAITAMGMAHVRATIGEELPLYVAGYSVGGALALDYTLDSLSGVSKLRPDRVFLYTPAIGVSAAARFSSWDVALSHLPIFEKFAWLSVEPEFDPYKFNSFAKNAGDITYQLTQRLASKLARVDATAALPPIITFQSLVDSTVRTRALVDELYERLPDNGSELVLFDINRAHDIEHFINDIGAGLIADLDDAAMSPYAYTLVTNESGNTRAVEARTRPANSGDMQTLALAVNWPDSVYSLSHVALMFTPDDRWYGSNDTGQFKLGTLAPRGETAILSPPVTRFMRLRYNPFYDYLAARTVAFCNACR